MNVNKTIVLLLTVVTLFVLASKLSCTKCPCDKKTDAACHKVNGCCTAACNDAARPCSVDGSCSVEHGEILTVNGYAFFADRYFEALTVNGALQGHDLTINKMDVNGSVDIYNATVGSAQVNGALMANMVVFNDLISVNGDAVLYHCTAQDIKILNKSENNPGAVALRGDTVIKGSITFESGKGTVTLYDNAKVVGDVNGGEIIRR